MAPFSFTTGAFSMGFPLSVAVVAKARTRLVIGLRGFAPPASRIANPLQVTNLPHIQT